MVIIVSIFFAAGCSLKQKFLLQEPCFNGLQSNKNQSFSGSLKFIEAELSSIPIPLNAMQVHVERHNQSGDCITTIRYDSVQPINNLIYYYQQHMDYDAWELIGLVHCEKNNAVLHFCKHDKTLFCVLSEESNTAQQDVTLRSSVLILLAAPCHNDCDSLGNDTIET